MPPSGPQRTTVFVAYSHRDAQWLERIRVHLRPLERDHAVHVWDDTQIRAGAGWRDEINRALDSARVALLLVSADFLASDFIVENELPRLLHAARHDGATILPLIVSPSRFASTRLSEFQAVNDPTRPLTALTQDERERTFVRMTERILGAVQLETGMRDNLSPQVLTVLRQHPAQLELAGRRRHVTLLRTDVRGFTTVAEKDDPETGVRQLHDLLTLLTEIVFDLDGTLDRYEGHSLTAYWGAPVDIENAAERACTAALRMLDAVRRNNPRLEQQGLLPTRLQIAITSGDVIVGNLGSDQRFQYSIIGDIVSLVTQLIGVGFQYSVDVILTESTQKELRASFETRLLSGNVVIKGRTKPLTVFELVSASPART